MDVIGVEIRKDLLAVTVVNSSLLGCKIKGSELIRGESLKERLDGLKRYISANSIKDPLIALALPRNAVLSNVISIPSPDHSSIKRILGFELEKHVPFKAEDAYWGFETIGRKDSLFSVLFAAVRKNTVDKLIEEFRAAGLEPVFAGSWQASIINALAHLKSTDEGALIAVIGMNTGEVSIDVLAGFVPVYSSRVSQSRLKQGALASAVASELGVFLNSADAPSGKRKLDGCMSVSLDQDKRVLEELSICLGMPVTPLRLYCDEGQSMSAPAFGAALCAVGRARVGINLLPSTPAGKGAYGLTRTIALAGALAGMLLMTGAAYLVKDWVTLKRLESAVAEAKLEKQKVQGVADSLKSADERIRVLEEIKGSGLPGALDVLKETTVMLPPGTWLTDFEYNSGVVIIEGYSDGASAQLIRMEQSAVVEDAEFAGPVTRKGPGGQEHFRIKMKVMGSSEPEVKGAR